MNILFQALGGLGLFIYGMKIMSEGLQKVAGKRLRYFLKKISDNRFIGCTVGAIVTSIIQSSSATTVMVVSFVNAGLMTLTQAVGVVLGANVGTTMTAQLIAFKLEHYALPAIAIGVALKFFAKKRNWQYLGEVLLGFGILFYGLKTMGGALKPISNEEAFINFFTTFSADSFGGILLCVSTGTLLTMLVQSSSATVGITMVLATQGLIPLDTSIALILGDNIGTTITAELSAIGTNTAAKETARAHTLFNTIGVLLVLLFFPLFIKMITWITASLGGVGDPELVVDGSKKNIARYIANAHTMFNVVNCLFFLSVLPLLVKVTKLITVKKQKDGGYLEDCQLRYIDAKYIDTPEVAIEQARQEILRMGKLAKAMYDDVILAFKTKDFKLLAQWHQREAALDELQKEITDFLVKTGQGNMPGTLSKEMNSLLRMINNFERIGDSIENIAELIEKADEEHLIFSKGGIDDYGIISKKAGQFIELLLDAIENNKTDIMKSANILEEDINIMRSEMRDDHVERLRVGTCMVDAGLILIDILSNFEKIGDYCYNIAEAIAGEK